MFDVSANFKDTKMADKIWKSHKYTIYLFKTLVVSCLSTIRNWRRLSSLLLISMSIGTWWTLLFCMCIKLIDNSLSWKFIKKSKIYPGPRNVNTQFWFTFLTNRTELQKDEVNLDLLLPKRIEYILEWNLKIPRYEFCQSLSAWKGVQSVQIM